MIPIQPNETGLIVANTQKTNPVQTEISEVSEGIIKISKNAVIADSWKMASFDS